MKSYYYTGLFLIFLFLGSSFQEIKSQSATDIFLLDLDLQDKTPVLSNPQNITKRMGYDNQASFSPAGDIILYTSIREDKQADIYSYHIASQQTQRLTKTGTSSEYSPKVMHGGKFFSVVRVESDNETQRLWRFSLKNPKKAKVLLPKVKPVGYYTWYNPEHVAMFILGDPHTLKYTSLKDQALKGFHFPLGRSLHTVPGTESVSFVDKSTEGSWKIKLWNSQTGETQLITETLADEEDYCWTPTGLLLMGKDEHLYAFNPQKKEEGWKDLGNLGIGDFYRISCSPDGKLLTAVAFLADK